MCTDNELMEQIKKDFNNAQIIYNEVIAKYNKRIADAQIAYNKVMALREKDKVAVENQIGEENTLIDLDKKAKIM